MSGRKIGVYVCQCGGNISDYVDVEKVVEAVEHDPDVVVARTAMFTCSDATQQEIVQDAHEKGWTRWSSPRARPSCTPSPSATSPSAPA